MPTSVLAFRGVLKLQKSVFLYRASVKSQHQSRLFFFSVYHSNSVRGDYVKIVTEYLFERQVSMSVV